jgi:hypothetical protein
MGMSGTPEQIYLAHNADAICANSVKHKGIRMEMMRSRTHFEWCEAKVLGELADGVNPVD